jgi:hypothetical protein
MGDNSRAALSCIKIYIEQLVGDKEVYLEKSKVNEMLRALSTGALS